MISAGDFRNGITIEMDNGIYQIIEFQHVKPGKGAAFVRTKLKNIISGGVIEKSFRPQEKFPQARIDRRDMQYLYNDGDLYYFMDVESYDQIGLNEETAHIINGHVPVEQIHGESPLKCGGKLLVIDGGFSRAYHAKTGISGYTLVCNSRGMWLAAHETFESAEMAIRNETDITSDSIVVENFSIRKMVADTDKGKEIKETIYYLEELLEAYRDGSIKEFSYFGS